MLQTSTLMCRPTIVHVPLGGGCNYGHFPDFSTPTQFLNFPILRSYNAISQKIIQL